MAFSDRGSARSSGQCRGVVSPGSIYDQETAALADASTAQDIVNLFLVAPLTAVLGVLASRGSLRAYLCWLGFVAFTVYNYAIYAFSIHFGPLFLVWVSVLGLSLFAMIGGLATLDAASVKEQFRDRGEPLSAWPSFFLRPWPVGSCYCVGTPSATPRFPLSSAGLY